MKPAFNSSQRLGKKLSAIFFLGCLLGLPFAVRAQIALDTYNSPPIVNTPQIVMATNFVNAGVWNIFTQILPSLPFQTFRTYNWTNSGTMNCLPGWEFDYGPYPYGNRGWSANFFNDIPGTISAQDFPSLFVTSQLLIRATNIVNKGLLSSGPYGQMVLQGSSVNLSRSGLQITPVVGAGSSSTTTNFTPDAAIYDEYWAGGTNAHSFNGATLWNGTFVNGQSFNCLYPCSLTATARETIGPLVPTVSDSFVTSWNPYTLITTNQDLVGTNVYGVYSNSVRQAIFVYVSDPSITPSVRFGPKLSPTNYFRPMAAQLLTFATNVITGALQASAVYVADDLAAVGTNGLLLKSTVIYPGAACTLPTYRPDSVVIDRADSTGYYNGGVTGLGTPTNTFFYQNYKSASFSNAVVVGRADTYSALVDNLASQVPAGYSATNAPGRIEIYANNLNLSKARVTAGGALVVQASNLVASAGATMDCQYLTYNLGSTNGNLNFLNLANPLTQRFQGTVNEYSGLWTNYLINIYTNWILDTTTSNAIRSDITNIVEVDLAITVVDASGLGTTLPVTVQTLALHSTNIVMSDYVTVTNSLLLDGLSFTITNGGGMVLAGGIPNWTTANAPTLRYFTNNGSLIIPNAGHFGDDGPTNYAAFVNGGAGTISAGSETINSTVFQAGGSQSVSANFTVTTSAGQVQNGTITSGQSVQFTAGTLKLLNATITAGDVLNFNVSGAFYDAGGSSGNVLICNNGFNVATKPSLPGNFNLLGTEIETITPVFANVDHTWPAADYGASSLGYTTNNLALGQLVLSEGNYSEFSFHAAGPTNAMYVDLLDLSQCPDFQDPEVLTIDPNFTIYYAAAKLPGSFSIPVNSNGIPQEAEEYLNGYFGGRLQWVGTYAGPNSSVYVLINGQSVLVNKALRYSKIIDSNGDGIPNFYDPNPFNTVPVNLIGSLVPTNPPSVGKFAVSWTAAPNTVYQVQYSTSYFSGTWLPLKNYTNNSSASVPVTVWDTNPVAGQRYYRVSHP